MSEATLGIEYLESHLERRRELMDDDAVLELHPTEVARALALELRESSTPSTAAEEHRVAMRDDYRYRTASAIAKGGRT